MAGATPAGPPPHEGWAPPPEAPSEPLRNVLRDEDRLVEGAADGGLRRHTARGTLINTGFRVGLAALTFLQQLIVAAFLTEGQFGTWGIVLAVLLLAQFIRFSGAGDRYVQQTETDQERAFQQFFTVELLLAAVAVALSMAAFPLFALAYGRPAIIVPGLVLTLAIMGTALQSPNAVYYRRMDFVRQRKLELIPAGTTFVLTVGLAVDGAGYWSLIVGAVVGSLVGAAVALRMSTYRPALRLQAGTLRTYFDFSWPLVVARGGGLIVGNVTLLIATSSLGLAAAGAIGIGIAVSQLSVGVDSLVTQTLYPAICAVRHRRELLFEAFTKSNRLALMWGTPFGMAVVLFSADLVHYVLGNRWTAAIVVLQAFGVVAAVDQVGFNWTAFLRALDRTRPLATLAVLDFVTFLGVTAPLLVIFGLKGYAIGLLVAEAVILATRTHFLRQLFPGFPMLRQAARAVAPTIPGLAAVLLARTLSSHRTVTLAAAEVLVFSVLTIAATLVFERALIRELVGYVRPPAGGLPGATTLGQRLHAG